MASNYDALRLLQAFGWREKLRLGDYRILVHDSKPGVEIVIRGPLSQMLTEKAFQAILRKAGLDEGKR